MDIYQLILSNNPAWTRREMLVVGTILFLVALFAVYRMKKKRIRAYQALAIVLAAAFIAIVFGSTVFTRNTGTRVYQLELFWSWKEILGIGEAGRVGSTGPDFLLVENLLNMILLLPLGLLLPFARGRALRWWQGLLDGLIVSAVIEVSQLIFCRGLFEFDDMVHNSLGCMVGCVCGSFLLGIRRKNRKKSP